ncbi:MAG: DUF2752 domain-containing protein [Clostridia bacterium]|nr:DUF2752 domain-containing protein [Clostridia bacterium]
MKNKINQRKKALFLLIFINLSLLFLSLGYALVIHLSGEKYVVECAFKNIFGLYCPGCGGSRSVLYLYKLDFLSAFLAYPPIYLLLFFLVYLDTRAIISIAKDEPKYFSSFNLNILIIIPVFILVFFLLRNIALVVFGYDFLGDILTG